MRDHGVGEAHPQSATVGAGQAVTFNVTASGTAPLSYRWQRGTTDIAGATSASYTFTPSAADNGATFRVIVSNSLGSATSNSASRRSFAAAATQR